MIIRRNKNFLFIFGGLVFGLGFWGWFMVWVGSFFLFGGVVRTTIFFYTQV